MKVWVVEFGEQYESSYIVGIYRKYEDAILKVLEEQEAYTLFWDRGPWKEESKNYWKCGIDYLHVTEREVL